MLSPYIYILSSCTRRVAVFWAELAQGIHLCFCALMLLLRRESCVDTWKCWKPIGQKKRIPCALANRLTPFLVTWYTITAHRAKSEKNSLCKIREFPVLWQVAAAVQALPPGQIHSADVAFSFALWVADVTFY